MSKKSSELTVANGGTLMKSQAETPESGRLGKMMSRGTKWVNLVFLMDCSGSEPEEGLNYLLHEALPTIFTNLKELGRVRGYRFNVCVMGVSTNVDTLVKPCTLEEALEIELPHINPHGCTNLKEAIKQGHHIIDAWKEEQDANGEERRSSMLIALSDCMATNCEGFRDPLGDMLVREIKQRMETGTTNHFVIGYGEVDEEVMHQMGGGVKYRGGDFRELDAWQQIALLIERGSMSNRSGANAVRYTGGAQFLLEGDVIEVDPTVWEIVE